MRIRKNLIKTLVLGIFVITTIFTPSNTEAASNYREGTLLKIKGNNAAVYKIGNNGKKYVYPNKKTFDTWHDDFSEIKEVELEEMDDIDDGGTVPFQAGTKLITHPNTAKVYAVGDEGELVHIPDEATALRFYGDKWASLVTDVDPGLFSVSYKVKKGVLSEYNLPEGSLVKEEKTGEVFIIEDGQRRKVAEEALRLRKLIRKYTIRLNELDDSYDVGDEYEAGDIFEPSGTITFEDGSSQHALTSFKGISWDNDGKYGGTGWGVYNTSNSKARSGSKYVLNRHGINFLGFTFPRVVNFKGAYFAMAVSNAGMAIDYPGGYSATKLRYHFYDENSKLIKTSDWFDLQATSRLFAANIDVKRVVIEHDVLNTTVGGFNTQNAEWFSMDNIMYTKKEVSTSGNPLDRAYTLYRDQLACGTDEPVNINQTIQLRDDSGRVLYGNFRCVNRYQSQCIADGSFDTYYKEYCTDINGDIIDMGEEVSVLPDITVSDIIVSPSSPIVNATTTVTYSIKNSGNISLTSPVGVFDTLISLASQDFIETVGATFSRSISTFNPLNPGEIASLVFTGYFPSTGEKTISMTVDKDNDLAESNENNNTRTKIITVVEAESTLPDITVSDIITIPSSPTVNATTIVKGRIKNSGTVSLTDDTGVFDVTTSLDFIGFVQTASSTISNPHGISSSDPFNPGEVIDIVWTGYFTSIGEKELSIMVDDSYKLEESSESNNIYSEKITVLGDFPDLKVSYISIYPNNPIPIVNESTIIAGYIQNRGNAPLTEMFQYSKSLEDFIITTTTAPSISTTNPLEYNDTVWFYWTGYFTSTGEKTLSLIVDELNQIVETDETNNFYTKNITVVEKDIIIDTEKEVNVLGVKEYLDGTLLRGPENRIYVLENGHKVHITSLEELFKYIGQEIINVSREALDRY